VQLGKQNWGHGRELRDAREMRVILSVTEEKQREMRHQEGVEKNSGLLFYYSCKCGVETM